MEDFLLLPRLLCPTIEDSSTRNDMSENKPTLGARKRFETLEAMIEAEISLPKEDGQEREALSGTIVDISVGCMCLRVPMDQVNSELMHTAVDGDFIEVHASDSPQRHWTVMGHLAWVWAPPAEDGDSVGSLGVDIAGVIEEDERWIGRVRSLLSKRHEVRVDRARRPIDTPARRRAQRATEASSEDDPSSDADSNDESEEETSGE